MRGKAALEYLLSRPLLCTPEAAEVARSILERDGLKEPRALAARRGRPVDSETAGVERRGPVTVIPVSGPIARHADLFTDLCGGTTTDALARDITAALDDPTCSGIVLDFDTPGGESNGIGELAALIRAGTDRKPIVGYAGSEIASAGYYLGSACSELVVGEMSQVGCIGVVMGFVKRDDRPGVKTYQWVSSQSPDKRPDFETEKGRGVVQQVVDDLAAVFVADVAKYRDTTTEDVTENFGRGSVLVGLKAVNAGMADRIGSLEDVIEELSDPRRVAPKPTVPATATATPAAPSALSLSFPSEDSAMALSWLFKPKSDGTLEAVSQTVPDVPVAAPPAASVPAPAAADLAALAGSIDLENTPAVKALRAQVKALELKAAADRSARLEAVAASFVQAEHVAGRIVPTEAAGLYRRYLQAARDDEASPLADGSRVAALTADQAARPKHGLYAERLGPDALPEEIRLLGQRPDTGADRNDPNAPVSTARTVELLAKFPAGAKLLATEKAGK